MMRGIHITAFLATLGILVVELQAAFPGTVLSDATHGDIDPDVAGPDGLSGCPFDVPNLQSPPKQIGMGDRNGDEIPAVHGDTGPLSRLLVPAPLFVPSPEPDVPQSERLHGRCLAGIVRPDENNRATEFDLDRFESLEVADGEVGQHGLGQAPRGLEAGGL